MKKSLLALAALTAFAGVASAQSSVTAFGIVDLAARNVKNGSAGSIKSLSSGGQATSRIGFRGVEDLGGGMRAGFWLESEVVPDTGAAGSTVGTASNVFWARRATVSLMGGFGELRLGRDFTPTYNSFGAFDIFGYVGVASPANVRGAFYGNAARTTTGTPPVTAGVTALAVRNSNTISYFLPAMGGLYGQLQVAAGEGAVNQNKSMGARIGYAAGPINVSASYGKLEKHLESVDDLTTMNAGASFNAGFATFGAVYEKSEYSTQDQTLLSVTAMVPMGAGTFKAQYTKSSGTGPTGRLDAFDAKMFGIGYVYSLSKRTSLYANYGSINNGGTGTSATVGSGATFTATTAGPAGMFRGATSSGYEFGLRHDF